MHCHRSQYNETNVGTLFHTQIPASELNNDKERLPGCNIIAAAILKPYTNHTPINSMGVRRNKARARPMRCSSPPDMPSGMPPLPNFTCIGGHVDRPVCMKAEHTSPHAKNESDVQKPDPCEQLLRKLLDNFIQLGITQHLQQYNTASACHNSIKTAQERTLSISASLGTSLQPKIRF